MLASRTVPQLCGHALGRRRHVCVLYSSSAVELGMLAPYVRDGLACQERVLNVIEPGTASDHLSRLETAGVSHRDAVDRGAFVLRDWKQTYLAEGGFTADAMRGKVRSAVTSVRPDGFARLRCWGNMGWLGRLPAVVEEVVRYEEQSDLLSQEFEDDIFVCSYPTNTLPPRVMSRIAALHPIVVFDGVVYENAGF